MKHSALGLASVSGLCAAMLSASALFGAEDPQPAGSAVVQPAPATQVAPQVVAPAKMAYGVEDVVKLTRAQVSEDVIATFIETSGAVYNLKPADILTLHEQGVSDRIVTLMLAQGHVAPPQTNPPVMVVAPTPAEPVVTAMPAGAAPEQNPLFIPGQNAFEIAAAGPPVTYDPPSTVYVIPDTTRSGFAYRPVYSYFSSYPSYGGYYGYGRYGYGCASSVIRIGGSYHHRGYYSFHRR